MNEPLDTNLPPPPDKKKLLLGTLIAMAAAAVLLVLIVLPAEYGIDPTGFGRVTGLTAMAQAPTRSFDVRDVVGGNEDLREVEVPDFGEPVPLPNPAVFQEQDAAPETRTLEVTIPAEKETEIKLHLNESKVALFSWQVDQGSLYSDFHGHDPSFGQEFFVRYKEHQEGSEDHGSLTAPFSGEHGWYWLNYNEFPITVTLTVTGYFDDVIDYGIF